MAELTVAKESLAAFQPGHEYFVGVDSDGCVFNTMEIKQKQCFHPIIISHWHLEPIAKYVRQTAEFVNLYSCWRGGNRFMSLKRLFDLLAERPEVRASGVKLPDMEPLERFIASGAPLGNPSLEQTAAATRDPGLASVLEWSRKVNAAVAEIHDQIRPFNGAREALEKARATCVSAGLTPTRIGLRPVAGSTRTAPWAGPAVTVTEAGTRSPSRSLSLASTPVATLTVSVSSSWTA